MRGLRWEITGIWKLDDPILPFYGTIDVPQDDMVEVPLGDTRSASVTLSVDEPVVQRLSALPQIPYAVCARAWFGPDPQPQFWGVMKLHTVNAEPGTVRLDAADPSLRMLNHHLRRGDLADTLGQAELRAANGDQGWVSVDHRGMRALRDAADTTGFAPLGIANGFNDVEDATNLIAVGRGDQVWEKFVEIRDSSGPDFDLRPVADLPGSYVRLNTYQHLGDDLSQYGIALHHRCGRNNLDELTVVSGETYRNLIHANDSDARNRVSRANATTLARTGPYIGWESVGSGAADGVPDSVVRSTLQAYADDVLKVAGEPSRTLTLVLSQDANLTFASEFYLGDTVPVAGRAGNVHIDEEPYRIVKVTLRRDGEHVRQELDVVRAAAGDLEDGDDV